MSTPSAIGITSKKEPYNGKVLGIYCHWDGYPEYMVPMLSTYYNSPELATDLVNLGDLSSLKEKLVPTTNSHSFDNPEKDVTIAYHRDRQENWEDVKPQEYPTQKEFYKNHPGCFGYLYDLDECRWYRTTTTKRIAMKVKKD